MRRLPLTLSRTALTALTRTTTAIAAPTGPSAGDCPTAAMHAADPLADSAYHGDGMTHDGAAPHGDHYR